LNCLLMFVSCPGNAARIIALRNSEWIALRVRCGALLPVGA